MEPVTYPCDYDPDEDGFVDCDETYRPAPLSTIGYVVDTSPTGHDMEE